MQIGQVLEIKEKVYRRFSKDFNKNIFFYKFKNLYLYNFFSKDIEIKSEYFIRVDQDQPCMQMKGTVGIDGSKIHWKRRSVVETKTFVKKRFEI